MGRSRAEQEAIDAIRATRPSNRLVRWQRRICPECGETFIADTTYGRPRKFCKGDHGTSFKNRCMARGKVIIPYLMVWRGGRGAKGTPAATAHAELNRMLDSFLEEDRKAGRPKLDDYVAEILDSGYSYIDRKRS